MNKERKRKSGLGHKEEWLSSGGVACAAWVSVETWRYYERNDLLPPPPRSSSGYRRYPLDAVRRLHFVKKAQVLGFSLREIRELLGLRGVSGKKRCGEVRKKAEAKIAEIDEKLRLLRPIKRTFEKLARACRERRPTVPCPVLEALDGSRSGKERER
ncbi:MAG: MerR family transcriptional regulator [Candidatus Hydrogenedentota bacterium]|nr:MAG: MerR family transcriptional regulator [Candidatus Hydrogenedentota bacterium]